eukprot:1090014-Rhodomonas_salina.1
MECTGRWASGTVSRIVLRSACAMPGTDKGYAATRRTTIERVLRDVRYCNSACYAVPGTERAYGATVGCYALLGLRGLLPYEAGRVMSGTEAAYGTSVMLNTCIAYGMLVDVQYSHSV